MSKALNGKMSMYMYHINNKEIDDVSVENFLQEFFPNDNKKGRKKWLDLKEALNQSNNTIQDATYNCKIYRNTNNEEVKLYWGIGLHKEHIKELEKGNNGTNPIIKNGKLDDAYCEGFKKKLLENFEMVGVSIKDYIYDDDIQKYKNEVKVVIKNTTKAKNFTIYQKILGETIKKYNDEYNNEIGLQADGEVQEIEGRVRDYIMEAIITLSINMY